MERSLHEKLGDDDFVAWKRKAVKEIQEEIKQSKEEMRANMARSKAAIEEQNDKMRSKYSTKGKYDAVQGQLAAKGKAAIAEEEKPPAAASTRKSHK